jgi:integrase
MMSDVTSKKIPTYRKHKATGQARVTLNGKTHYLGKYGSADSKKAYDRLVQEWLCGGRWLPSPRDALTVNEVILAYVRWAMNYYGASSNELACTRDALKIVKELYGRKEAHGFGPKSLKAVRARMVQMDWSRNYINAQVGRIKRCFRWATSEELVPGNIFHALQSVAGIRKGRENVRETEPVRPVPDAFVQAAMVFMPAPVKAMVEIQLLTGCRPGEVCAMCGIDLDMSGRIWIYRPGSDQGAEGKHKTAYLGKKREIYIGPRCQEIIKPWFKTDLQAHLFNPAEWELERNEQRRKARLTPLWPSHVRHQEKKRKKHPRRTKQDHYDVAAYRRAIARACQKADDQAHLENSEIPPGNTIIPRWHPNQLRHNAQPICGENSASNWPGSSWAMRPRSRPRFTPRPIGSRRWTSWQRSANLTRARWLPVPEDDPSPNPLRVQSGNRTPALWSRPGRDDPGTQQDRDDLDLRGKGSGE